MSNILEMTKFYSDNFSQCIDTIENCSYDSINKTNFCTLKTKCYNFDKIKELVCFGRPTLCSVDSLIISQGNNTIYFIEFKNKKFCDSKKNFLISSEDSFVIYNYLETFYASSSTNKPKLKAILVLEKIKNSTFLSSLKRAAISHKLDNHLSYKAIKERLVNIQKFGKSILFDEIIICSQCDLHKFIK